MTAHRPPTMAPLFLRLALGITFIWAGLAKIMPTMNVSGEQAATLANLGVLSTKPDAPAATGDATPKGPESPAPEKPAETKPAPSSKPDSKPETKSPEPAPAEPKAADPKASDPKASDKKPAVSIEAPGVALVSDQRASFTARDFPEARPVRRVHGVTLLLASAGSPQINADGTARMRLWPAALSRGSWPVILAWAVAITEAVAGLFLLVGFLTRISALSIVVVMLGAMWLTEIGPAVQAGGARLGFLPTRAWDDGQAWIGLLWQFTLLMSSMALAAIGPGGLSFDRALFGRREHEVEPDDHHA